MIAVEEAGPYISEELGAAFVSGISPSPLGVAYTVMDRMGLTGEITKWDILDRIDEVFTELLDGFRDEADDEPITERGNDVFGILRHNTLGYFVQHNGKVPDELSDIVIAIEDWLDEPLSDSDADYVIETAKGLVARGSHVPDRAQIIMDIENSIYC